MEMVVYYHIQLKILAEKYQLKMRARINFYGYLNTFEFAPK